MDSELLRRGCERAGLVHEPGDMDVGVPACWVNENERTIFGGRYGWDERDPALPSYVADILVGMVREAGLSDGLQDQLSLIWDLEYFTDATTEQRITAALAVLEAGDGR